jgi:uncharacterized membrane protein
MYSEYSGGPQSTRAQITQLMSPRGGTTSDGLRLAIINGIGLVVVALLIGIVSLITRAVGLPNVLISFGTGIACIALAVFFWFRYAEAHGRAARARQNSVRPDVFGSIAAIPFAVVGLLLVSSGLFGLFLAMVTFSLSRAGAGLERLLYAIIFLGLAVGNVIVARAASD